MCHFILLAYVSLTLVYLNLMPTLKPCSRLQYEKLLRLLQILAHSHRMKIHCNQLSTWFSATQMYSQG